MAKVNPFVVAGVAVIFVAFLLLVIGTATDGWVKDTATINTNGLLSVSYGSSSSFSSGLSAVQDFSYGHATKAFAVLSILASIGALGTIIVYLVFDLLEKMNDKLAKLPIITHIVACVGAVFALISIIIYAAKTYPYSTPGIKRTPDYSWVLVIIGGVFLEVGGFLCHKAKMLGKIGGSG